MKTVKTITTKFRIECTEDDVITVTAYFWVEEPFIQIRDDYGRYIDICPVQAKAMADALLVMLEHYPEEH